MSHRAEEELIRDPAFGLVPCSSFFSAIEVDWLDIFLVVVLGRSDNTVLGSFEGYRVFD
jgi:hypothetical protein